MNINLEVKLVEITYNVSIRTLKLTFNGSYGVIVDTIDCRTPNYFSIDRRINGGLMLNTIGMNREEFKSYMSQISEDLRPLIGNYLTHTNNI